MPILMRSPDEVGSWIWYIEAPENPDIGDCLEVLEKVANVLEKYDLFKSNVVETCWNQYGRGKIGIWTKSSLSTPFSDPSSAAFVKQSQPAGFPDSYADFIETVSLGTWIDEHGRRRRELQLINLSVDPDPGEIQVEIRVHHDIWSWYDFSGHPHPEIYKQNAPRLAAALEEVEKTLGVETENGESTYFGTSEGFWIKHPDEEDLVDGLAMDATDRL